MRTGFNVHILLRSWSDPGRLPARTTGSMPLLIPGMTAQQGSGETKDTTDETDHMSSVEHGGQGPREGQEDEDLRAFVAHLREHARRRRRFSAVTLVAGCTLGVRVTHISVDSLVDRMRLDVCCPPCRSRASSSPRLPRRWTPP